MGSIDGAFLWDIARRQSVKVFDEESQSEGWAISVAWSPDGTRLAVFYRGQLNTKHEFVIYDVEPMDKRFSCPLAANSR